MKKLIQSLSVVAALTLTACATPLPPPAPNSIPTKVEQYGQMEYLQVSNIIATKRNHLMAIQAEILNTDSDNQQLFYRFKWLDRNGMVVGDDEAWQPLLVYAGQKQTINALAPSPQATDFRILVSSPDNTGNP
jgi:uncharacterized protein YcfL